MRIIIRTKELRLWIPIPNMLVRSAAYFIPESALEELRIKAPEEIRPYITKPFIRQIYKEIWESLAMCKGTEIIHVEAHGGTFVSIKM